MIDWGSSRTFDRNGKSWLTDKSGNFWEYGDNRQWSLDPAGSWNSADTDDRSWRYFDDGLKIFYNDNKQVAWGQYLDDQVGTNQTPLRAYLNQNFDRAVREYYRANERDERLMFTDTLDANLINGLRQSFYLQSPGAKGYALAWMPSGRFTG